MKKTRGLADKIVGKKFGKLTILCVSKKRGRNNMKLVDVICECGKRKTTRASKVMITERPSCGIGMCKRVLKYYKYRTVLYRKWCSLYDRCYNKKNKSYKDYGGNGITVSKRWHDSERFIEDMHPLYEAYVKKNGAKNSTLDRVDYKKGYSKENCRWATIITQANNKRTNILIKMEGRVQTLAEWCREKQVNYFTIYQRIKFQNKSAYQAFALKI